MSEAPRSRPPPDVLADLYARTLAAADAPRTTRGAAGPIALVLTVAALATIGLRVLLDFPNSGDEYVYLYQARTLAAGRLWNPAAIAPDLFAFNYILQEPARTFGTFPPGWPLALAVALTLHVPVWLLNPLLGALTLTLVRTLGARLYTARIGLLAAILVGIAPFFVFNAASYFSHTFCGALLLGAACIAAREDRTPAWVPLSVGLLVGWAVVTRYLTGVVCAVPIVWWLVRPGVPRGRTLLLVALGGLPWVLLLMAYDTALAGSPWRLTTTPLTVSRWFARGVALRGADILSTQLLRHLLWTPPVIVAAYAIYLRTGGREIRRGWFAWLPLAMAGLLYFYVERGGNQYGPRFHYEVFPFAVLFVVANVFRHADLRTAGRRDRVLFALLAMSAALMPIALVAHAVIEHRVIRERMDPFAQASATGLHDALVLIGGRVGTARSMAADDLTRNDLDRQASVLFGLDPGHAGRCAAGARLPMRMLYLYSWDAAASSGLLQRLVCP